MIWIGIGVILIGVALLIGAILLIKPLNNLSGVLGNLQKTTETLPEDVQEITAQTKTAIGSGINTLHQVNDQVKELSPIFYIIGDAGRATNQVTSSMLAAVDEMKAKTQSSNDLAREKNLEGLYGALTLGYFLFQRGKANTEK